MPAVNLDHFASGSGSMFYEPQEIIGKKVLLAVHFIVTGSAKTRTVRHIEGQLWELCLRVDMMGMKPSLSVSAEKALVPISLQDRSVPHLVICGFCDCDPLGSDKADPFVGSYTLLPHASVLLKLTTLDEALNSAECLSNGTVFRRGYFLRFRHRTRFVSSRLKAQLHSTWRQTNRCPNLRQGKPRSIEGTNFLSGYVSLATWCNSTSRKTHQGGTRCAACATAWVTFDGSGFLADIAREDEKPLLISRNGSWSGHGPCLDDVESQINDTTKRPVQEVNLIRRRVEAKAESSVGYHRFSVYVVVLSYIRNIKQRKERLLLGINPEVSAARTH
jgi:hypothetical protein